MSTTSPTPEQMEAFDRALRKTVENRAIKEEIARRKKQFKFVVRQCACGGNVVFKRTQVATVPSSQIPLGPNSMNYYESRDECYCTRCGEIFHPEAELIQEALNAHLADIDREVEAKIRIPTQTG